MEKVIKGLKVPESFGFTWRYCSPEAFKMIDDGCKEFTERTKKLDVYSFAIVAFEIITGGFCWKGVSKIDLLKLVSSGERPSIPSYIAEASDSILHYVLNRVISKCWAQDPDSRPNFDEICALMNKQ